MPADPFSPTARLAAPVRHEPDDADDDPAPLADEAAYVCDACGEEVVIPVDVAAGASQEYVEDCPVCCRPNVVTVSVGPDGSAACSARPE